MSSIISFFSIKFFLIKSARLPVNIYGHRTLNGSKFKGAREHQDEALQERYQHHCTASLHREYARACVRVCVCVRAHTAVMCCSGGALG